MKKNLSRILVFTLLLSVLATMGLSALAEGTVKIAMLPKFKGENYFDACKVGAQEAIDELNKDAKVVEFLYDGPSQDQATNQKQVDILEGWIAQQVNVIIVSPNDPVAIAPTLKKAMEKGIKVLTFDADAQRTPASCSSTRSPPTASPRALWKAPPRSSWPRATARTSPPTSASSPPPRPTPTSRPGWPTSRRCSPPTISSGWS
jgi:hypothetical protein